MSVRAGPPPKWSSKHHRAVPPNSVTGEQAYYDPDTGLFDAERKALLEQDRGFNDVRKNERHVAEFPKQLLKLYDETRAEYITKHKEQTQLSIKVNQLVNDIKGLKEARTQMESENKKTNHLNKPLERYDRDELFYKAISHKKWIDGVSPDSFITGTADSARCFMRFYISKMQDEFEYDLVVHQTDESVRELSQLEREYDQLKRATKMLAMDLNTLHDELSSSTRREITGSQSARTIDQVKANLLTRAVDVPTRGKNAQVPALEDKEKTTDDGQDVARQHVFLDLAKKADWAEVELTLRFCPHLVNCQPSGRWSALHHAAEKGPLSAVQMLIAKGANIKLRNNDMDTPLDVASCDEIQTYLKQQGRATKRMREDEITPVKEGDPGSKMARTINNETAASMSSVGSLSSVALPTM